ncbi:MAG: glycosyltransferase [Bacteroidetes bacterium]|jgi:glycosyltransferase involved in cell wall biosynthesis|nr:glycosyltransferase [Bacteroidota bacterium]
MPTEAPSVLFINRVYPPAGGATGAILSELAADLVADGWRVGVVTGPAPDAPAQAVTDDGVHVYRVPSLPFTRDSFMQRLGAYLSLYPMLLIRAARLRDYDVVVTKTDPPMQLVLGPLIKAWTGAVLVHWAQDLYPEIAEAVDVVPQGGWLAEGLRRLSTWALRRHDRIVAVGRCMKARIDACGVPVDRIAVMPNWPPQPVQPAPHAANAFRAEQQLGDSFVVMYSGNMGLAHTFAPLLDAAERLQGDPEVVFLFVGEGPRRAEVEAAAARRGLANVRFLPFQPMERLAESLSAADLHVVTMRPGTEGLVVPSKLYGVLAAGRPVLLLGADASEAARVLLQRPRAARVAAGR